MAIIRFKDVFDEQTYMKNSDLQTGEKKNNAAIPDKRSSIATSMNQGIC